MPSNILTGLPIRPLRTQPIKAFRGMNNWILRTALTPDAAEECLNVVPSGSGGLEKMRLPVSLSPALGFANGPQRFFDFQQAVGTRQVVAQFGPQLYLLTNGLTAASLIDGDARNNAPYSAVEAQNVLYMANGARMMKWLGSATATPAGGFVPTGAAAPVNPPSVGLSLPIFTIARAANVVTADWTITPATPAVGVTAGTDPVSVAGVTDASFDGQFVSASSSPALAQITWAQVGPNGASGQGAITLPWVTQNPPIVSARLRGVATYSSVVPGWIPQPGESVIVAGFADATFNGTVVVATSGSVRGNSFFTAAQPTLPDSQAGFGGSGTYTSALTPTFGWQWAYAYFSSVTGHCSNVSPRTPLVKGDPGATYYLTAEAPTDAQYDSIAWFRTTDGEGDLYLQDDPVLISAGGLTIADGHLDTDLNQDIVAPLVNNPPLPGFYQAVFQNRVYIFRLEEDPQGVIYSGFEQILFGVPPESFPPNNRLRLAIGANEIAGGGVIAAGVVAFSRDNRMYMQRGVVEDITTNAPVVFSSTLQELPYKLGCFSHETIRSLPSGLAWFSADKTFRLFDGSNPPVDISGDIYPLLRTITPGAEGLSSATDFKFMDRNWYVAAVPTDGAQSLTKLIIFDMTPDATLNRGVFPCDLQADYIGVVEDPNGQRMLCIAQAGVIKRILAVSDTTGGVSETPTATNGVMQAFWRGGYFGNDQPDTMSLNRYGLLMTDCEGFSADVTLVDDVILDTQVVHIANIGLHKPKVTINRKAKRCKYQINFPAADQSANVLGLTHFSIPTGQR